MTGRTDIFVNDPFSILVLEDQEDDVFLLSLLSNTLGFLPALKSPAMDWKELPT